MPDRVDSANRGTAAHPTVPETAEVRDQAFALHKELDEAASKFERLQNALVAQQQLEQLLRQGRAHLETLQRRLQEKAAERDLLQMQLTDRTEAHRLELERLQEQIHEDTRQALAQRRLAEGQIDALRQQCEAAKAERDKFAARLEEREQELESKVEEQRRQILRAISERDRFAADLEAHETAHSQFAAERTEERLTFERLLAEARSNQRDMIQELDEQSKQNAILREAAIRAQSLARQIMNAQEPSAPKNTRRK